MFEVGATSLRYERATLPAVIARLDRATQYSRDAIVESRSRGVLDRPVKPDDDSCMESEKAIINVVPAKAGTHNHRPT